MSFSAPKPPDPTQTANTQQQYNQTAATNQNKLNSYNQSNAFGSTQYVADPNSPSGYSVSTNLNPQSQGILDTQRGTIGNLATNSAGMYSSPYDFNSATGAVASKLNDWNARYVQPIFNQQDSNLEAQLHNQGLQPGTEAYNNAKNLLARNQGDVTTNYLTKNEGQAFGQALQEYQTPLQTIAGLEQTLPGNPTFQQTPTAQIQPANYQGAVQSNYQGQVDNYNNTWNNIGKLGTAAVSLGLAPLTGGTSLAGMFATGAGNAFNSATNGWLQSNPYDNAPKIGGGWG